MAKSKSTTTSHNYKPYSPLGVQPLPYNFADLSHNIEQLLKLGMPPDEVFDTIYGLDLERTLNFSVWSAARRLAKG